MAQGARQDVASTAPNGDAGIPQTISDEEMILTCDRIVRRQITDQWNSAKSMAIYRDFWVNIQPLPRGIMAHAAISGCHPCDEATRQALADAVRNAGKRPSEGFERMFVPNVLLDF